MFRLTGSSSSFGMLNVILVDAVHSSTTLFLPVVNSTLVEAENISSYSFISSSVVSKSIASYSGTMSLNNSSILSVSCPESSLNCDSETVTTVFLPFWVSVELFLYISLYADIKSAIFSFDIIFFIVSEIVLISFPSRDISSTMSTTIYLLETGVAKIILATGLSTSVTSYIPHTPSFIWASTMRLLFILSGTSIPIINAKSMSVKSSLTE